MPETVITVQGSHAAWFPAERASVSVNVQFDGPERDDVFARATEAARVIRLSAELLADSAITWWSADNVRVWSERPWSQDGARLPLVYSASVAVRAKFRDFAVLAVWIEQTAAIEGVTIAGIEWQLTEATRTAVTAEVRSRSVKDAVTKATVFAQSIGLGSVSAIALADPGMLGEHANPSPDFGARSFKSEMSMDAGGGLAFKPEEIEVASTVDARFVAR